MESVQTGNKHISILIAEDHALYSQGICMVLEASGQYEPIWQAVNGKIALEMARTHHPQLILMDIMMPEINGLQAARLIKAQMPDIKIIMLTTFTDENSVKIALSGGVDAYCSKDIDRKKLLAVIQMVMDGAIYLDPKVAGFVLKNHFKQAGSQKSVEAAPNVPLPSTSLMPDASVIETPTIQLLKYTPEEDDIKPSTKATPPIEKLDIPAPTPIRTDVLNARELELLSLIADNRTNEEIATILKISGAWVDGYIKNIIAKLAVENEVEAVRRALEDGVIQKARMFDQDN